MEIHIQQTRHQGLLIDEEESQVVHTHREASLTHLAEEVARSFGQRAERKVFLFRNGRTLEDPPLSRPAAKEASLTDLGVETGEEFLYIAEDGRKNTYLCRVARV